VVSLDARVAAIRQELTEAQRGLQHALDRIGADGWSRHSPSNEGWTIQELLTHLSTAETSFVPTLKRMSEGQGGVPQDFDPNRWNAGQLRRRAESSPQQLRIDLEAAHAAMLSLLDSMDDVALDQRGYLSTGVEGSTEDCFRLVASHKRSHTQDIEAALTDATR
jgi:DinB superfamily